MQLHSFTITEMWWNFCHVHYAVYVYWFLVRTGWEGDEWELVFIPAKGRWWRDQNIWHRRRGWASCCSAWRRVLDDVYKWLKGAGERRSLLSVVLHRRTVSMATNQNKWKFIWPQESTFTVIVVTTRTMRGCDVFIHGHFQDLSGHGLVQHAQSWPCVSREVGLDDVCLRREDRMALPTSATHIHSTEDTNLSLLFI